MPAAPRLFTVPAGLIRIFDRDLVSAGLARSVKINGKCRIDKRDERGRTLDVHALRTSFATLLSKGNVAPRTAQAAMRHSTLDLTMNVYTDPKLLDVHGALDALPSLPLDSDEQQQQRATGTQGVPGQFTPEFAPTRCKPSYRLAITGKTGDERQSKSRDQDIDLKCSPVKRNNPLTTAVGGLQGKRAKGLEPSTSSLGS